MTHKGVRTVESEVVCLVSKFGGRSGCRLEGVGAKRSWTRVGVGEDKKGLE
jgi:hypothetical protein